MTTRSDRVVHIIVILAWIALSMWLVFWVGGWWRWLGVVLLVGLLHPATWKVPPKDGESGVAN